MSKIKLYFLTGFLGAGKTTILRNLLENMEGTKVGVIQNELGKISIDGTVLQNNDIQMIELNRGSIFCSCLRLSFVDALTQMATLIFDTMKKVHGLGRRERLLLQVAAILHDCGKYISFANAPQCAYDIIMSSEIMGLSHLEREIVAGTVLYNSYPLADYEDVADRLDQQSFLTVAKLSAILRVSNAMDRSHKQKFKNVKAQLRDKELIITIETDEDIALEKALFASKTAYFERIFSIKPVVKEKRVYS